MDHEVECFIKLLADEISDKSVGNIVKLQDGYEPGSLAFCPCLLYPVGMYILITGIIVIVIMIG